MHHREVPKDKSEEFNSYCVELVNQSDLWVKLKEIIPELPSLNEESLKNNPIFKIEKDLEEKMPTLSEIINNLSLDYK